MKNSNLKRIILALCFIALFNVASAVHAENNVYYLFNNNTEKFYRYYILQPGETYSTSIEGTDSLVVYTRILLPDAKSRKYSYEFNSTLYKGEVTKKAKLSKSTRGVSGVNASGWNSYKYYCLPADKELTIKNTDDIKLLVKVSKPGEKVKKRTAEYFAYTPDEYELIKELEINENKYEYYSSSQEGINIQLEGPAQIKVISRLIVNDVDNLSYSWEAFMDGRVLTTTNAVMPYSGTSLSDGSSLVTKGAVHYLDIPAGIHNIVVKDIEPEDIIYKFYLKKPYSGK